MPVSGNKNGKSVKPYESRRPAEVNEYYMTLSSRFRAAKLAALILFVLFLILMLGRYRSSITYDNFRYLIRDLDTSYSISGGASFASIRYDAQTNMRFQMFRDELAVAGSSRISLYNSSGMQTMSEAEITASPVLEASDKYLMMYDLGSYRLTLYNSFTKVLEETFSYPIYGAEICDSGAFAVLTGSLEAKYEILLYNSSFSPAVRYYKNKYVIDIALRDDGREIAILSTDSTGGNFTSELMVCAADSSEPKFTDTIESTFPLSVQYHTDGRFSVVCENRILFYDTEGVRTNQYDLAGMQLACIDATEDRLAVVAGTNIVNSENHVLVFDTEGNLLYNELIPMKLTDVAVTADRLYLLSTERVLRIRNYTGDETTILRDETETAAGVVDILAVWEDGAQCALMCTETATYNIFDETGKPAAETASGETAVDIVDTGTGT